MSNINYNFNKLTPFKFFCLTNFPFIEEDFDALTYYELLCKVVEYLNKVIDTTNAIGTQTEELTNAFNELKSYVDNYFTNLDVQTEINNKLDEMAQDGTLQQIISSYLNTKALLVFDNVESMKNSNNLIDGSYAETLGYYNKNDGGKATYKIRSITNNDVIDNAKIIPLKNNNLIAELVDNNIINIKQFGAYGDNEHDDTEAFKKAIDFAYSLPNANNYNSFKVIIPKGKYLISSELRLTSSTLNGSELSNISIEGEGQGTTVLISNFSDNGNLIYLNASSKFSLKNMSFKNLNSNVDVTALKIAGSSMLIDLTNLFAYKFYVGFDLDICVGNVTNCFANSCNCGFKTKGTSTNFLNCYASQCSKKNEINDFEGCGYYINSTYSVLEACASDSNFIAYKIIRYGVTMLNCGMEGDTNGIIIKTPNSNTYQAPIIIDGYLFDNIQKPTIKILTSQKVIIKNHNFSLDYDYVDVASNLPTNVVEYENCNFYVTNESLYPSKILIPLDNIARKNGLIYNFDGFINEGKGRLYKRSIKWRVSKTNLDKLYNGRQVALLIKAFTIKQYSDSAVTTFNEEFATQYTVSQSYLAKALPNYDNTKLSYNRSSDDNYYYFELTPLDTTIVPENNLLCYEIRVLDNTVKNLNNGLNLIEFEGLDY